MSVILRVGAEMRCDEPDCPDRIPAELVLLGTGTLAFRPADRDSKWEVALPSNNMAAPFSTRCPKHKRSGLVTAPAALGAALAKAH